MTEISPAEEFFFAALEKTTPAEQAAYLDIACAGQPDLRARVEKLLAALPRVGGFLEPASANANTGFFAAAGKPASSDQSSAIEGSIVAGKTFRGGSDPCENPRVREEDFWRRGCTDAGFDEHIGQHLQG